MKQPLALVLYERLLSGSQLTNRLQDLGYRVQAVTDAGRLVAEAAREKPLLLFADVGAGGTAVASALEELHKNADTAHIPVIAITRADDAAIQAAARATGAKLVVTDTALLAHLDQFLEQALQLD